MVSVITNTYNHKEYIADAIESVLMQKTTFSFELIIGEDGSSDGTREICLDYAEKYPNQIRLFLRSRKDVIYINGRPTGRHNIIENIKSSSGKYIALLPGDDYWTDPLKLQKQIDILESDSSLVACHHWHDIAIKSNEGNYIIKDAPKEAHGYNRNTISDVGEIFKFKLRPQSRTLLFRNVFKAQPLPDWFIQVMFGDIALSIILGRYGKFYFIDEPMAVYRVTGSGISSMFNSKEGAILGNKEWIRLMSIGLKHHQYKYNKEALEGFRFFLNRIKNYTRYDFTEKFKLLKFLALDLSLPVTMKIKLILFAII